MSVRRLFQRARDALLHGAVSFAPAALLLLAVLFWTPAESGAAEESGETNAPSDAPSVTPTGDVLQFLDGSVLHGRLSDLSTNSGVGWRDPDAPKLLHFQPADLAGVRFESPTFVPAQSNATCRLRFNNGDEVFGQLQGIDQEHLQLQTWFGGVLQAPRAGLQSVTFLSKGYSVLYEGPTSAEGWVQGRTPRGWEYRDGSFVATSAGTLGRDFRITGSSSLSFDLSWTGNFSLILALYTPVLDRFDYSSSCYMIYLNPGYVTLQRIQGGSGAINLGQAQIPEMGIKSRVHFEVRANTVDATIGLFADDHLVQRWKDPAGFVAHGSGVVFFAQLDGPSIHLGNVKVAQWEGELNPLESSTNRVGQQDLVYLVNHDKVSGKVDQLQNDSLTVTTTDVQLKIPLTRVSQINLRAAESLPASPSPWDVQARFAGGGTLGFRFDGWKDGHIVGISPNFGPVELDPRYLRQLQFNLARTPRGMEDNQAPEDLDFE